MTALCSASWSEDVSTGDLTEDIAYHLRAKRLLDVQADLQVARFLAAQPRPVGRDHDAKDVLPLWALRHLAQELHSVHDRHVHVGEHGLDGLGLEDLKRLGAVGRLVYRADRQVGQADDADRKSTRLNSSHG